VIQRNAIRSNRSGQVGEIHVTPGQTVNHGALLITFND
jgi:biotin carboxyl carrier protein